MVSWYIVLASLPRRVYAACTQILLETGDYWFESGKTCGKFQLSNLDFTQYLFRLRFPIRLSLFTHVSSALIVPTVAYMFEYLGTTVQIGSSW